MVSVPAFAAAPLELERALATFRSDPPREWSFVITTEAEGKSTVERCNAARPEFDRWSLVKKDGRAPTPAELQSYGEARSRRSRTGTAPKISDQFLLEGIETVSDSGDRVVYRCPLRPGEARDDTARSLRATITVHKPTATIESVELANIEPFSPALGVRIAEMRTRLSYSLPVEGRPSLPLTVITHVRGRAFFFKSLDADMTVTFSEYTTTNAKPPP